MPINATSNANDIFTEFHQQIKMIIFDIISIGFWLFRFP